MQAPLFYPAIFMLMGVVFSRFLEVMALGGMLFALLGTVLAERRDSFWTVWRWRGMVLIFGFCWGFLDLETVERPFGGQSHRFTGEICSEVKRTIGFQRFDFRVENCREKGGKEFGKYLVTTRDRREFRQGDFIEVQGRCVDFQEPKNPGEFNERAWQHQRGILGKIEGQEIRFLEGKSGLFGGRFFLFLREKAKEFLSAGGFGTPEEQILLRGMVLGDTEGMDPELKEKFRSTGTGHIFAVSGQNLGVILLLLIVGMRLLKVNAWRWGWMTLIPLYVYSGVSGFQSSCIRAWMMLAFVLIAWRIDRPAHWLNFWSVTLILILLWSPQSVEDIGFQLSFLVVLALITMTPWVMDKMTSYWEWERLLSRRYSTPVQEIYFRWRKEMIGMGVSSTVAFLATLPHAIFVFHQFNGGSILLNLLVVPLAGLIVMGGSLSFLVGGIQLGLSAVINFFLVYLAKLILFLVHSVALMTWLQIPVCDFREWRWGGDPQIVLLDLGEVPQGMIRYRGATWLINTGNKKNYERRLRSVLKYYGIAKIEGVFLTTVSESSNGGLIELLKSYSVGRLIRPSLRSNSPLEKKWEQQLSGRVFERWQGVPVLIQDSDFRVIEWSGNSGKRNSELKITEDQGSVLQFKFGDKSLLWGNRISERRERELMGEEREEESKKEGFEIEVLVQGRNPRESHLSEDWLRSVNPKYLILSSSGEAIQKTGYDLAWNLRQRTTAEIIFLEKRGAVILEWGDRMKIRPWRDRP